MKLRLKAPTLTSEGDYFEILSVGEKSESLVATVKWPSFHNEQGNISFPGSEEAHTFNSVRLSCKEWFNSYDTGRRKVLTEDCEALQREILKDLRSQGSAYNLNIL